MCSLSYYLDNYYVMLTGRVIFASSTAALSVPFSTKLYLIHSKIYLIRYDYE